jgi:hypothetical protein
MTEKEHLINSVSRPNAIINCSIRSFIRLQKDTRMKQNNDWGGIWQEETAVSIQLALLSTHSCEILTEMREKSVKANTETKRLFNRTRTQYLTVLFITRRIISKPRA